MSTPDTAAPSLMKLAKDLADEWEIPKPRSKKQAAMLLCGVEIGRNQMRKTALHMLVDEDAVSRKMRILSYD